MNFSVQIEIKQLVVVLRHQHYLPKVYGTETTQIASPDQQHHE